MANLLPTFDFEVVRIRLWLSPISSITTNGTRNAELKKMND